MPPVPNEKPVTRDQVVEHLEQLNKNIERQMSPRHVFRDGVIYGIGFIIGSTVLTALVVTIVLQFLPDTILADVIQWIARSR